MKQWISNEAKWAKYVFGLFFQKRKPTLATYLMLAVWGFIALVYLGALENLVVQQWLTTILQGLIVSVIGGCVLIIFILPKMAALSTANTVKALKKDPEIAPIIEKGKEIIKELEPLVKEFRKLDFEKMRKDIQPFLETAKRIDPKAVEELFSVVRSLAKDVKQKLDEFSSKPPNMPAPDPD